MNRLSQILSEQSSPAEVLVFLAVTVAIFLGLAFLIYVLIMALLRLGLPTKVTLMQVLLPGARRVRENLGDYVLAVSTSILLTLSLVVKHDLVQQIADYDMGRVGAEAIAVVFDFGLPEDLAEEIGEATLGEVVQPLLAAGKVEESDLLVRSVIAHVPKGWMTAPVLIAACIVLAAFYVAWLARRRYLALRKSPDSAPQYSATFRPLLTLALCVGLLLASALPLAQGGEKFLARSAIDAIGEAGRSTRQTSSVSRLISQELRKQRERAAFLYCAECEDPGESIWQAVDRPSGELPNLGRIIERVESVASSCQAACDAGAAELGSSLDPLQSRLGALESRLNDLQRQLALLGERQIPDSDRAQARQHAEFTRQLEELNRRLTLLTQQFDRLGGVPGVLRELQRRVAWLESQHRQPAASGERERDAACERYAQQAVEQQRLNIANSCRLSGPRWSDSIQVHYEWCLGASTALRRRETSARDAALGNCRPPVQ